MATLRNRSIRNIAVLTGAGISAESGLATFRAADGLWEGHRVEDVATPEAYRPNPALVHQFYDARRARLAEVEPSAAHCALAKLDAEWPGELLIVTQNVDDLHERAGARRLLHMHGELTRAWCLACDARFGWSGDMGEGAGCAGCGMTGSVRPDIVWFGEMPYEMGRIEAALARRPGRLDRHFGRGLPRRRLRADRALPWRGDARAQPRAERGQRVFEEARAGRAGELVPAWVEEMLAATA